MGEILHTTRVKIYKDATPIRRAYIEGFEPITYGVHGGIKHLYGLDAVEDRPTTLDHLIAAVAG
ncbi:MAG: hypothetical protein HYY96_03180 [Candidatus Tectomicrobia bacterium]|nr:hypothetical protein [Candidatus Tectomicrobia bacterium]